MKPDLIDLYNQENKKKNSGGLKSFLPTAGGIGGSLGGATTGAAIGSVVPGVGTAIGGLLGALLGGAGGSALGKFGQNAIEGEKDLGKGVASEALFGGATSLPITGALKLLKAGGQLAKGTVTGAGSAAARQSAQEAGRLAIPKVEKGLQEKAASEIASTAAQRGVEPGLLSRMQNTGLNLKRDVAGTSKVADSFTQEQDLIDVLSRNGITGSAANQYKAADKALGNLSKQIDERLSTISTTLPRGDVLRELKRRAADILPDDEAFIKEIGRSVSRLEKSGAADIGAKDLFRFKQELNQRLSPAFKKMDTGAPLTAKEEADMALWRSIDDDIVRIAPEVKQMTLDQSKIITARPGLQKSSEKTMGIPILGIKSKALERGSQALKDRAGSLMLGKAQSPVREANAAALEGLRAAQGAGILGTVARQSGLGMRPELTNQPEAEKALDQVTPTETFDEGALETAGAQSLFSNPDVVQALYLQALQGGNTELANAVLKGYELFGQTASKPLSAEAAKVVSNAQSGLSSLDNLESQLAADPSVQGKSAISSVINPFGITGRILGTGGYEADRQNIIDVIARLRTGAAITNDEAQRFAKLIPEPADSPELVSQKLNTLRSQFEMVANRSGSAGTDLQQQLGASL